ncbi:YkgJ family cysteine cluster protein [Usitatibacter palustris]|uniref:YkgJ family cysteine cluster protein n=1 Tax=Usitatibacter palustris TaxID=2732487 RepID=UPI001488B37C|nr:YkgJ family cysteine cluster protein [Usitatibacter palustris]
MSYECTSCGACCASYRVSFYWSDGASLPESMVEKITPVMACMAGSNSASPRCVALQGAVGERVRCSVYEQRPPVCRDVVPGDERCLEARRRHGLTPTP